MNLKRHLQEAIARIEFIAQHGDCYDVIEALDLASDAYAAACRQGCDVEMGKLSSVYDALRLVGRLSSWLEAKPAMLTVKQAAERLNVSPRTVYDLIDAGQLPCQRIGTGRGTIRVHPADLDNTNRLDGRGAVASGLPTTAPIIGNGTLHPCGLVLRR